MGNQNFKGFMNKLYGKKDYRLLITGLDAAGKTTLLYRLKLGEVVTTIPTIGFNVETIDYGKLHITAWDVGGRDKIKPLLRHYYPGTNAMIFIVDSNDRERISESKDELQLHLSSDELNHIPILVMANKQDLPNTMSVAEITEALDLHSLKNREWHVQTCSATAGEGLMEGLDWLHAELTGEAMKKAIVKPISETAESVTKTQGVLTSLYYSFTSYFTSTSS